MKKKSVLENALLEVESLEEAVKKNAKGILESTMKQELNDLLNEQEDEEEDVADLNPEDEGGVDDIENDVPVDDEESMDDDEAPIDDEINNEDMGDEDVLDMTNAPDEDVLKIFKAMNPEDGIVVKKDGNNINLNVDGEDFIIKLNSEDDDDVPMDEPDLDMGDEMGDEENSLEMGGDELETGDDELETGDEDEFGGEDEFDADDENELSEQEENSDEAIYEIELDDEDDDEDVKKSEVKEGNGLRQTKKVPTELPEQKDLSHEGGQKDLKNPKITEPGKGKEKKGNDHEGGMKDLKNGNKKELGKGTAKIGKDHEGGQKDLKGPKTELPEAEEEVDEAARTMAFGRRGLTSKKFANAGKEGQLPKGESLNEQVKILKEQNKQYKEALILFKDKLQEVAVFNSNLAYSTRLFTEHSTTKNEKLEILKRFDTVKTKEDSKNLFEQINTELGSKKSIAESVSDKITLTPKSSSTKVLSEAKVYENPQFKRIKELMFKK